MVFLGKIACIRRQLNNDKSLFIKSSKITAGYSYTSHFEKKLKHVILLRHLNRHTEINQDIGSPPTVTKICRWHTKFTFSRSLLVEALSGRSSGDHHCYECWGTVWEHPTICFFLCFFLNIKHFFLPKYIVFSAYKHSNHLVGIIWRLLPSQ